MSYALTVTVDQPFETTLKATRTALSEQGFGILTEIDLAATLKAKLDEDIAPQVILGACRPSLAYAAIQAEPSIGLLLPCNVVVRSLEGGQTLVEAMDPTVMVTVARNESLADVAAEAGVRLSAALTSLAGTPTADLPADPAPWQDTPRPRPKDTRDRTTDVSEPGRTPPQSAEKVFG